MQHVVHRDVLMCFYICLCVLIFPPHMFQHKGSYVSVPVFLCCESMYDGVSDKSVCMRGSTRDGCIFRLALMRWDSTLQGLADSQTPLLPRKHAAAWHRKGATQFNCFWLSEAPNIEGKHYNAIHIFTQAQMHI